MKYIVIVPDGMADDPVESLGGKTPLEVANTTNMDYLAQHGSTGLVRTIPEGMKPGSDIGNLAIMGYDPKKDFTGRAPLEAANLDVHLAESEVAFRCNLVTLEKDVMSDYSAGHISTKEADPIIESLNNGIDLPDVKFYTGKSYRHLMVTKSARKEDLLNTMCTPPHDILGKNIQEFLPKGSQEIIIMRIMEKARDILKNHEINKVRLDLKENPANSIWLWGQGTRTDLPKFQEKFGITGSMISAVDLVNGIGKLAGLEVIDVPGITGYYDTNYKGKAEYALESLKEKDFVYIHIEAPDEAGHNGHVEMKKECIERIDKEIVGTILNHFHEQDDVRILVLPDHPTPVELRTHTDDPVGFVMYGKGIPVDGTAEYNETVAKTNGIVFESGEQLLESFIKKHLP